MHVQANIGELDGDPVARVRVAVYGSSCPACTQAKAVLDRFHVAHVDHPISALPRRYGAVRSMPQITIDGELLGGVNQLLKLARAGGLERVANDDPKPWVRIKRRLGRGYDVVLLDTLGRELLSRRAATQAEATRIADELATAAPTARQAGGST
jgi:glutaredoxin